MYEQIVIFGIFLYLFLLIFSGIFAIVARSYTKALWSFIFSNIIGLIAVIFYFFNFSGQVLRLASFDWFLQFSPQINALSAIFFVLVSGISALVGVYSLRYLSLYEKSYNPKILIFLLSFFVLGMQGVLLSNNAFSFLFFWELMSITSFFLVLSDRSKESIKAAFLYFIMTHLGASAILGGFLIIGNGSIFFELSQIQILTEDISPIYSALAFSLFIFGFGSKAGLVPFHVWLPEAHPQAPSNISAMMSGLMLKIAVYGFIVVILSYSAMPLWAGAVVAILGLLSGLVGALNAVTKRDIKTALAYSSIENLGIIFAMLGVAIHFIANDIAPSIATALVAFAIIHVISHALFKTALFLSSGVIINRVHHKSLDKMGGIAKLMPYFSGAFLLVVLASLPIPPFGTFYAEWGFIQSLIQLMRESVATPNTVVLLIVALSFLGLISGLAIFAMTKIFSISMLGLSRNENMETRPEKQDYLLILPIFILGLGVFLVGIFASPLVAVLKEQVKNFGTSNANIVGVNTGINSWLVATAIIIVFVLLYVIDRFYNNSKKVRFYNTWDCGQAIDASMQYSATAFSAPIRFFFLTFIGRDKKIDSVPLVSSNPWIRKYSFYLHIRSVWSDALYDPIAKALYFAAEKIRFVQNGRIQYYILFLLSALILTLIFAL